MPATCSSDGCDRPVHGRTLCRPHYMQARRRNTLPDLPDLPLPEPYVVADRLADLRLAVQMADARLRQAVIVAAHPEVGQARGVTVGSLIDDALDVLARVTGKD